MVDRRRSQKPKTRMLATEFARELASRYGCGRRFEPVECWHVPSYGNPEKVMIIMVRGSCDYFYKSHDYADTTTRNPVSSRYLFPTDTHKRPAMVELQDSLGSFRDWASDPKK